MSYTKLNLQDGEVLTASHLAHMENGISNDYNNINLWEEASGKISTKEAISSDVKGMLIEDKYQATISYTNNGSRKQETNIKGYYGFNHAENSDYTITLMNENTSIPVSIEDFNRVIFYKDNIFYKWVALGDSITDDGSFVTDKSGYHKYYTYSDGTIGDYRFRYTHYALHKLRPVVFKNFGIAGTAVAEKTPGDTTCMSRRYVNMDDDADLVTVFGGINDGWFNVPLGQMGDSGYDTEYGAFEILCKGLRAKYPRALIVFITPFHQASNRYGGPRDVDVSRKVIIEYCEKYGFPYFDAYTMTNIYPNKGGNVSCDPNYYDVNTVDGIHLNSLGAKKLGYALGNFILNLI